MRGGRVWKWLGASATALMIVFPAVVIAPTGAQAAPLCNDSWTNPAGGSWSTNADWSTGLPPTSSQNACINIPVSAPVLLNVTSAPASLTVGGTSGSTVLEWVGGGALTLGGSSSITADGEILAPQGGVTLTNGATLTNDGTIDVTGTWQVRGNITNNPDGLVEVAYGVGLYLDSGTFANSGAVFVQPYALLEGVPGSGAVIDNAGGYIENQGGVDVYEGSTFDQGAGNVVGNPVTMTATAGTLDLTGDGTGTFTLQGTATLSGNIAAGQTVLISGNCSATGSFTNAGTLMGGSGGLTLTLPGGATLTNSGSIVVGPGNTLSIAGNVLNEPAGSIITNGLSGSTFSLSGAVTLTNDGSILVTPNSLLQSGTAGTIDNDGGTITNNGTVNVVQGGTFIEGSGTTTGNPVHVSGTLDFTGGGASSFMFVYSPSYLSGDIAAGQIVEGLSTVDASSSFTNNGTWIGDGGSLVLPTGDTLTNNGTIEIGHGGGGSGGMTIDGNLTNTTSGVMGEDGAGLNVVRPGTTFDNAGTLYLLYSTGVITSGGGSCGGSGQAPCDIDWINTGTIYWGVGSQGTVWGGFGDASDFEANTGDVVSLGGTIVPVPVGEPTMPSTPPANPTISFGIGYPTDPAGTNTPTWTLSCPAAVADNWSIGCPNYTTLYEYDYGTNTTAVPTNVSLTSTGTQGTYVWSATYGPLTTLTATVSAQDGSTPTGTVAFYAPQQNTAGSAELRTDLLGTATLTTSGGVTTATLTTSMPPGNYDLLALYLGDSTHLAGSDQYGNLPGSQPAGGGLAMAQQSTTIGLVSSGTPSTFGSPVTLTATVMPATGGPANPSGVVTFENSGVPFGTAPVSTSGGVTTAQLTTSNLPDGSPDLITAVYGGDYNYSGSSSSSYLDQTVTVAQPPQRPSAQITAPANHQTYALGAVVPTSFSCTEGSGGPGIATCLDSNGAPSPSALDTSALGTFTYTVTATSSDGLTGTASISYTVVSTAGTLVLSPATGLRGHLPVKVSGAHWNTGGDTSVALSECVTTYFSSSSCDASNTVTATVGTGTRLGQLAATDVNIDTGTMDTNGDTCGLATSGHCYLVAVGNTGDETSAVLSFSVPSLTPEKTTSILGNQLDRLTVKSFPIGDTVTAQECDTTVTVPATLSTNCDPATQISGTVASNGTVVFSPAGVTLLVGQSYADIASGTCGFGKSCKIVVLDQTNPSIWLSHVVTFAAPKIVVGKSTAVVGNYQDAVVATGLPIGDTVTAQECDASVSVPITVATNCDASTAITGTVGANGAADFSPTHLTLEVGGSYSDTAGNPCAPGGTCKIVVTDTSNDAVALQRAVTFAAPTAHVAGVRGIAAGFVDGVTAAGFPVGDTVTAQECDTTVSVPATISSNCDPGTAISGTASSTGAVSFSPSGVTVVDGNGYSESGTGSVNAGGRADIVVEDVDNPGIFVTVHIALAG